jgi:signal transduction histidine kinase
MNRIARLAGLALVLLLFFIAALAVTEHWLKNRTERTRAEMIAIKQRQFDEAVALARLGPPPWDAQSIRSLETMLGVTVSEPETMTVEPAHAVKKPAVRWEFLRSYPTGTPSTSRYVRVDFAPPAAVNLLSLFQQCALMLLFLALGLLLVFIVSLVFSLRARSQESIPSDAGSVSAAKAEINSLTQLAQVSARQSTELERERIERQRAEEDAHFQQMLLNRALEEKIRLGHDLHDGIIQSLYAAGLTVQAAQNLITRDPDEAARQLQAGLTTINATIREVRGYIAGLSPESLRQQTFAESVRALTQTLDAGRAASYDLRVDDSAASQLTEDQSVHLLQIAREAVSNALRHGGATQITVRLHQSADEICLAVQDNGKGFTPETASGGGHGLANMRARVNRLGAKWQFSSSPGGGTKLIVTLTQKTA